MKAVRGWIGAEGGGCGSEGADEVREGFQGGPFDEDTPGRENCSEQGTARNVHSCADTSHLNRFQSLPRIFVAAVPAFDSSTLS